MSRLIGVVIALVAAWGALVVIVFVRRPATATVRETLRLVPDTLRMLRRIAVDPAIPRRLRVRLWLTVGYLASPIDLLPDFVPWIGHADDVLVVAAVVRSVVRQTGPATVRRHWPGSEAGLATLMRLCRVADIPGPGVTSGTNPT